MMATLLTVVVIQAGWLVSVAGGAAGRPFDGPLLVALAASVRLARAADRARLVRMLAGAAVLGAMLDGSLAAAGVLRFSGAGAVGWPVPIWMLALWINFALALDSLGWLARRPALAALAGAAGGPLSYLAGARLGAVTLGPSEAIALAAIAVEWSLAMPLLVWSAHGSPRRGVDGLAPEVLS